MEALLLRTQSSEALGWIDDALINSSSSSSLSLAILVKTPFSLFCDKLRKSNCGANGISDPF